MIASSTSTRPESGNVLWKIKNLRIFSKALKHSCFETTGSSSFLAMGKDGSAFSTSLRTASSFEIYSSRMSSGSVCRGS